MVRETYNLGNTSYINLNYDKRVSFLQLNSKEIWKSEFSNFKFTGLDSSGNVAENKSDIVSYRFDGLRSYVDIETSLIIPETFNSKPVTHIEEYCFGGIVVANPLTSITIPNTITTIGAMAFWGCGNLTSIYIPASVTSIGESVFVYCSSLSSITVDAANPAYKDINNRELLSQNGEIFLAYAPNSGTEYVVPNGVKRIGSNAFETSHYLSSVSLPEGLEYIGTSAFGQCRSLTSITIPSTVTYIANSVFSHCYNLTEITLLSQNPPELYMTNAISEGITTIYVPYQSLEAYQTATNWSEFADIMVGFGEPQGTEGLVYTGLNSSGTVVTDEAEIVAYMIGDNTTTAGNGYVGTDTDVIIPSTYNGKPVTTIGKYAFRNKTEITSVNIPNSVTTIGNYAFAYCSGLTSIEIPEGVTTISQSTFQKCSGLTSIEIPASVTKISSTAFRESGLESVNFKEIL